MAQIRGPFPFPTSQIQEGGGVIMLAGGQAFYPAAGEYILTTGLCTCLQWFDPINQLWRSVQEPTLASQFISVDGFNWRLMNLSGIAVGAQITNAGSGGTNGIGAAATGAAISFGAAPAGGRAATAFPIVGGSVQAPTVTQGGANFLIPPVIVIDPPPAGGIQATAIATITAGAISGVTMVNVGGGYTSPPNFWILPQTQYYQGGPQGGNAAGLVPLTAILHPNNAPPGYQNLSTSLGALLTPNVLTGSGTLTGIGMLDYGAGYAGTTIPTITVSGVGAAAATAIMSFSLISVTLGSGGSGYTGAAPNWETSDGVVLGNHNNALFLGRVARGVTTIGGGAVLTFAVEDPGFGLQKVPVVSVLNTGSVATTQATGTAVVGGINDFSLLQPRVQ